MSGVEAYWQTRNPVAYSLFPLSWLFLGLSALRRLLYRRGVLRTHRLPVPVIIVGNIGVGGSGKTPLVIWLVRHLRSLGWRPGIVARGYGGRAKHWPQQVRPDSDSQMVGDEPVMIARLCGCPMSVGPNRVTAAKALLTHHDCDIIVSDDGLQHYALGRDLEIAVIDGRRRHGNGFLLPAGPLRELPSRLDEVDLVVAKGRAAHGEHLMTYSLGDAICMKDMASRRPLRDLRVMTVHALAGIGNPDGFFDMLAERQLQLIRHPFPDHHPFRPAEIEFGDGRPVLMTQKDAVKCEAFAGARHWFVPVEAVLKESFVQRLNRLLAKLETRFKSPKTREPHG
ncbi:MAG: tetraacyldisaccharide 4'-kinase [Gammaproteobacteria bacterium]|nr:tetraacyldisaccharide 4'-kinase [Gammaproteobacteria bacterium]MBU1653693.1 tetraacyldisaccharide 4'-kinase [Gammaproteobacteria bacterium]MBU1960904.1 tetraacyldisaccharide 4'-kinase [Gammaproteobacteria bacterium]